MDWALKIDDKKSISLCVCSGPTACLRSMSYFNKRIGSRASIKYTQKYWGKIFFIVIFSDAAKNGQIPFGLINIRTRNNCYLNISSEYGGTRALVNHKLRISPIFKTLSLSYSTRSFHPPLRTNSLLLIPLHRFY